MQDEVFSTLLFPLILLPPTPHPSQLGFSSCNLTFWPWLFPLGKNFLLCIFSYESYSRDLNKVLLSICPFMPWFSSYSAVYVWAVFYFRTENWVVSFLNPLYLSIYFWGFPNCMTTWLSVEFLYYKYLPSEFQWTCLIHLYLTDLQNSKASLSLVPLEIICFVFCFSLPGFLKAFFFILKY